MDSANRQGLPPELLAQMEKPKFKNRKDAHALCLAYCDQFGPATVDELLLYIWKITGTVKSRDYMYHMLKRLRDRGHLERLELESEKIIRHILTPDGEQFVSHNEIKYHMPEAEDE